MSTSSSESSAVMAGAVPAALRLLKADPETPQQFSATLPSTSGKRRRMTNPTTTAGPDAPNIEKIERTCPNCGAHLEEHKCELKCRVCHFFKHCSNYYGALARPS